MGKTKARNQKTKRTETERESIREMNIAFEKEWNNELHRKCLHLEHKTLWWFVLRKYASNINCLWFGSLYYVYHEYINGNYTKTELVNRCVFVCLFVMFGFVWFSVFCFVLLWSKLMDLYFIIVQINHGLHYAKKCFFCSVLSICWRRDFSTCVKRISGCPCASWLWLLRMSFVRLVFMAVHFLCWG